MKVGYNKGIGMVLLVLSMITCCIAAIFVGADQALPSVFAAAFWIPFAAGILFLARTYIEVTHNELIVRSLIGTVSRRVSLSSPRELSVEAGRIFLVRDGMHQDLGVVPWLADRRSWAALVKWIETGVIP